MAVLTKMHDTGIIPVFYNSDIKIVKKIVITCCVGGITIGEFTNRGDFAYEVFAEVERYCRKDLPDFTLGLDQ